LILSGNQEEEAGGTRSENGGRDLVIKISLFR